MSFVYVGVLVLSKVSWPASLSRSVVIVCVRLHKRVRTSVVCVCVCAAGSVSVFTSGCSFVLKNVLSNSVYVCLRGSRRGGGWEGEEAQALTSVCVHVNVSDAYCISTLTGATVVLCFKLLVCLERCFVWLRNGVNRGRAKQPGG